MPLAKALGTTLDELVDTADDDDDDVIRPHPERSLGRTTWLLSRGLAVEGRVVAKIRIPRDQPLDPWQLRPHPGRDWFTVLSGTARLQLGERTILVQAGDSADFSTMLPHAVGAHEGQWRS